MDIQFRFVSTGLLNLRRGTCPSGKPTLFGCREAQFQILGGDGRLLFSGRHFGTEGFETHAMMDRRCCELNHSEGVLDGKSVGEDERFRECSLCVTYSGSHRELNVERPCEAPPDVWTARFDGVIVCPC